MNIKPINIRNYLVVGCFNFNRRDTNWKRGRDFYGELCEAYIKSSDYTVSDFDVVCRLHRMFAPYMLARIGTTGGHNCDETIYYKLVMKNLDLIIVKL